ncbi:MAG: trimeric intracellular cation channel family protein [Ilumatobacteraceae bacterium]
MSDALLVVSVVGTIAFALSGVMAAAEAEMDWLGAVVLAAVAAIGGGTVRDVLLGETPVFWVEDEWPLIAALVTAAVAILALRIRPSADPRRSTLYVASDAVGLGAFVVVGTSVALDAGASYFVAAVMGVITGVGGGVLRDVLARRTPIVLVGEIYAVAGLLGAAVQLALREFGAAANLEIWLSLAIIVAVRAIAVRSSLNLPRLTRS